MDTRSVNLLLFGAVLGLWIPAAACTGKQVRPAPEPSAVREPAPEVTDEEVAEAAEDHGLDPEEVVERKREAERRVAALDRDAREEFRSLFGPDPLGLVRVPENAVQYEIPLEMNEQVEAWISYFQNVIPERFGLYLQRLGRYEDMILSKLRAARLPEDLIYLALIESGMNPNAYSRAHAVGMWQFIRSTGQMYDLRVSHWSDDRRDFVRATDAAIAHLRDLYDEFGSWYLAAAAYNGGAGRIRRALRSTGSTDFWDLAADRRALRAETREYVPKLIAAAIIAKNREKYGFAHIQPFPPLAFDEVEVPDATSLDVIAEAAATEESVIRELNPQYLRGVTPPGQRVRVRVPHGSGTQFAANYAKIPPSERVTWLEHRVTRGETLSQIAARYGSSVGALQAANGNVNPRRLQIGQLLIVPRDGRPASSGTRTAQAPRPSGSATVTVRSGDTLWSIARRHGVSTSDLVAWNNLSSTVIRPGDRLRVNP